MAKRKAALGKLVYTMYTLDVSLAYEICDVATALFIIMTFNVLISSKIKPSGATKPRD